MLTGNEFMDEARRGIMFYQSKMHYLRYIQGFMDLSSPVNMHNRKTSSDLQYRYSIDEARCCTLPSDPYGVTMNYTTRSCETAYNGLVSTDEDSDMYKEIINALDAYNNMTSSMSAPYNIQVTGLYTMTMAHEDMHAKTEGGAPYAVFKR